MNKEKYTLRLALVTAIVVGVILLLCFFVVGLTNQENKAKEKTEVGSTPINLA